MDDQNTIDADIVEESTDTDATPQTANISADVLLSLEEMIKNKLASLDKLKVEIKKQKEMFDDAFLNSEAYRQAEEKVKEVNKQKGSVREQIMKQQSVMALNAKIKDLRAEAKEGQNELSDYLLEYQRLTGATSIEDHEGNVLEIVNTSRAVKRS